MRFDHGVPVKIKDAYAGRNEPEGARVLGEFLWALLICILGLTILGSIGFGVWEFMRPVSTTPETSVSASERKGISRPELQKILEGFSRRAQTYESRRTAPVPVRDPS